MYLARLPRGAKYPQIYCLDDYEVVFSKRDSIKGSKAPLPSEREPRAWVYDARETNTHHPSQGFAARAYTRERARLMVKELAKENGCG